MGGTIEVSSEVDKGSIFQVELECRIPEGQADRQFWETNGISRILAAGADKEICRNIQMLMGNVGVAVDTVLSVDEALAVMQAGTGEESCQVVLLDWNVPDMDGVETVKKIRAILSSIVSPSPTIPPLHT